MRGPAVPLRSLAVLSLAVVGCARAPAPEAAALQPSILLITLDTTRADSIQPESTRVETPSLAALAAGGLRFAHAYSTVPTTLPAHASMLTGLYPAGHGVHENARRLDDRHPLLPEALAGLGYSSAAFVSGYPLERQFGLARGFDHYDDDFGAGARDARSVERGAAATTDRALAHLARTPGRPLFVWVHFYDPHEPYTPPPPFAERYREDPYLGEIAAMDQQIGRLLAGFERAVGRERLRVLVVGDHGEGRGDHGEMLHGNLLYQGVMRVPLVIAGGGIAPGVRDEPVSIRQVFPTVLGWAGGERSGTLLERAPAGAVLGEAMQPYLQYRWQPQVMAVDGRFKVIRSGRLELYDLAADPAESRDLAGTPAIIEIDRELRRAVAEYPLPASGAGAGAAPLDEDARKRLASLGYIAAESTAPARADAPRPADMAPLFADLDAGSREFVQERYQEAIPIFTRVLRRDPGNVIVAVRLAAAHSLLGRDREALQYFKTARAIDPESLDVRHYLALHHLRNGRPAEAAPLFEAVLGAQPDRLAALEGLAEIRERQGRVAEAIALRERAVPLARDPGVHLVKLGELRMAQGDSAAAIRAFERARELLGPGFQHHLELGVLYLAERRFAEAREELDRVPENHPGYAMALFKRAQVSVLLNEADRAERIRAAWERADSETRPLLRRERLFAGLLPP